MPPDRRAEWYEISREVESKGKALFKERKGIDIFTNVDFYSASLYYALGIPIDFFTPVFAVSRVAGWTAHVIEEQYAGAAGKTGPVPAGVGLRRRLLRAGRMYICTDGQTAVTHRSLQHENVIPADDVL